MLISYFTHVETSQEDWKRFYQQLHNTCPCSACSGQNSCPACDMPNEEHNIIDMDGFPVCPINLESES